MCFILHVCWIKHLKDQRNAVLEEPTRGDHKKLARDLNLAPRVARKWKQSANQTEQNNERQKKKAKGI